MGTKNFMWCGFAAVFFLICSAEASARVISQEKLRLNEKSMMDRKPNEIFSDGAVIALAEAAARGDLKKISALIAAGANVNSKGWEGLTPLFSALKAENMNGVEALLKAGASPNMLSEYGYASIHFASEWIENPELLKLLLRYGGNPNLPEGEGSCTFPLGMATFSRNNSQEAEQKIRMLVAAGADLNRINTTCDLSQTAVKPSTILVHALPRYDLIYIMLELGADPTLASPNGLTLRKAMENTKGWKMTKEQVQWKEKVVSFLQEKGAW